MKRLVRVLLVLAVLAVVVDFGARILVQNLASNALASRRGVNGSADVSFGGFPFLLAFATREFGSVTIQVDDVRGGALATSSDAGAASEVRIESVGLDLEDVTIEGDVWSDGGNGRVTATSGDGSATLSQNALNRLVPGEYSARLLLRDGSIKVTATTPAGAQEVEVLEDEVRLESDAGSGTLVIEAPSPVGAIAIPLPALVDGVVLEGLDVEAGALSLTFSVRDVNLEL